ncbi:serine hydrolase-domain-containing protein [Mucidula mucida]|nr:serine hydrolase-domain-containing protein [Mucidula mucida]
MSSRKILMLHGYGQNAYLMSRYMASITNDLAGEDIEFQYLDAPFSLTPADLNAAHASSPSPPKSTPVCSVPSTTPSASDSPRGWFTIVNFGGNTMEGIETSLALLKKMLKENRFEPRAAMAELLVAMLERPDLYPFMADDNGAAVHPPMQYIVAVSGFLLRGPSAAWDGQPVSPASLRASSRHQCSTSSVTQTLSFQENERIYSCLSTRTSALKSTSEGTLYLVKPNGESSSSTSFRNPSLKSRLPCWQRETVLRPGFPPYARRGGLDHQRRIQMVLVLLWNRLDVKEVDLQLGTSKLLVEEEEARMWDIYTGLVYQG